jgi:hypothetical protein
VVSLTRIPAEVAPVPFNVIKLLSTFKVVVLTFVVVPLTNKSPLTVKLEPVNSIAAFKADVYEFKLLVLVSIALIFGLDMLLVTTSVPVISVLEFIDTLVPVSVILLSFKCSIPVPFGIHLNCYRFPAPSIKQMK